MILAGLVGLYLAGRISKPLEVLDQAASAVSQGKLNQQVPITKGILELENLSTRFNQMTRDLHHSEQAKSAFIADVTHELQTPLTVIKGTVETLEDGALDDLDGRGDLLAAMSRETDRMINLVNDLLILTKAEVSALRYEVKPFHLKSLIEDRIQLLKQLAGNKEVSFQLESRNLDTNQDYVVQGDKNRTAQVLDNILDNALRHSPEKSPITITLDRRSNRIICEVKDQGPGIPSQHLPYIFERFYRVDSARDRRRGGSGLGLAIAKSLIEGQQGKIKAVSSPGDGTTIIFELPAYSSLS
jgi:signal transduction histidine kinase